ncbi:MAG: hypothetical protein RLZZ127_2351 [Planctomycetota bacterium]|jgi:predicted naringenin-chalcone synthase
MSAWITHLGQATPERRIAQQELGAWLEPRLHPGADRRHFGRFIERSGIAWRGTVVDLLGEEGDRLYPVGAPHADALVRSRLFAERAPDLAVAAVRAACPDGVGRITHVVVATCTGAVAPGIDLLLIERLGLDPSVRRTMVGFMGCYAAVPALRVARDAVLADPTARVLVVCCELSSLHLQPGPSDDDLLAASLFGDGAGAAVVAGEPAGCAVRLGGDACAVVPDTGDRMAWIAGPTGFALRLAPSIGRHLAPVVGPLCDRLLAGTPRDAARWAVHPGGPRILDEVEQGLGLAPDALAASRRALAEGGNRSSGTVLAILADLVREPWTGPCALLAFGPGLSAEGLRLDRC